MPRLIIYPYKIGSMSARSLKQSVSKLLRSKLVKQNGFYKPFSNHIILNWGASEKPSWFNHFRKPKLWLNEISAVKIAHDKLATFNFFDAINKSGQGIKVAIPKFTINKTEAQKWINKGEKILSRKLLTAHSGNGIQIHDNNKYNTPLPDAPLYVKYNKKQKEYRIHVFNNQIIDIQEKRRQADFILEDAPIAHLVRNYRFGWVFCRGNIDINSIPSEIIKQAILSVSLLRLDFGAVDVGYNFITEKVTVYEINTAPGLQGTTVENYKTAINKFCMMEGL